MQSLGKQTTEKVMAKKAKAASKKISFEQALVELQQVVTELESGSLGLDESLSRFEQGMGLLKDCHQLLEKAEKRVQLLTGFNEDGEPVTEDFDDERSDATAKPKAGRRPSARKAKEASDEGDQLF